MNKHILGYIAAVLLLASAVAFAQPIGTTSPNQPITSTDLGTQADATCGSAGGTCSLIGLVKYNNSVSPVLGAGSAIIGKVGIDQTTPGTTNAVSAQPGPVTTGGLIAFGLEPIAGTNSTSVKGSAGQVYHVAATNNSATVNYIRFYNSSSAPTCSSSSNWVYSMEIPASTSGAGFVQDISQGLAFSSGIGICVTSGFGKTDATNATASAIELVIGYK